MYIRERERSESHHHASQVCLHDDVEDVNCL
jgi:hypothetical protein